jgi:hypothetical protein
LLGCAFAGYVVVMLTNPVRASLRDGLRCMGRHGRIWTLLALFGLCYAVFQIGLEVFYYYNLDDGDRPAFLWSRAWFMPPEMLAQILKSSILPAFESVAGVFNNLITTFPFSAIAALMFLANWGGHHATLLRALRRRFDGPGWLVYSGILICAVAAIIKPVMYGPSLLILSQHIQGVWLLQCSFVIDWLSFLFEYLFGVCVQIYLILMVFAWVRGLHFTHQHLLDFAIRRFSFVMKWSAIVMLLSTLFIHLPLVLSNTEAFSSRFSADLISQFIDRVSRPVLAVFLILFSGMQIILTFHSESLSKALRDHMNFMRKDGWHVAWYLFIAALHFYALAVVNEAVRQGFGDGTAITIAWRLFYPLLAAFVCAWMLAAWVCLYKRSEAGRIHAENWIKY